MNNLQQADEETSQVNFYKKLGIEDQVTISKSTDGFMPGFLFEHKNNVQSYGINKTLSQALIYLARFNLEGVFIPKNILLVSLEENIVYRFNSNDFIEYIEDVPSYASLSASKGIKGFSTNIKPQRIKYNLDNGKNMQELLKVLSSSPEYTKVHIDEHNVIGWASTYYKKFTNNSREQFFKEIRNPGYLSPYCYPWNGKEEDFSAIMDLIAGNKQKKALGAFYTPAQYAKKSKELVEDAISKIPDDFDYIILDRCAGTGSLEMELSDEQLSHVIINTYEVKEWHALKDRLGKRVRAIIPPIPNNDSYPKHDNRGVFTNSDALSEQFIKNPIIKKYIENEKCAIIMYENPPYRDVKAQDKSKKSSKKDLNDNSFVYNQFKKLFKTNQATHRDLSNLFIWSAFHYYLKGKYDAYIVYSPIKYWKTIHLFDKKFNKGFIFNRKYFHANGSAISCIEWLNQDESQSELQLEAIDIKNGLLEHVKKIKVYKTFSKINDIKPKKDYKNDKKGWLTCNSKGLPSDSDLPKNKFPIANNNIIGFCRYTSSNFNANSRKLTRTITDDALKQSYGVYLRKEDYIKYLPLFAAKLYPQNDWYVKDLLATSSDDGTKYQDDDIFLTKCLIFTSVCPQNYEQSFIDNQGNLWKNEICLDKSSQACNDLNNRKNLDAQDFKIIKQFNNILKIIKDLDEFNPKYTYGLYQIEKDINVKVYAFDDNNNPILDKNGKHKKIIKYGDLNNILIEFKKNVKQYYLNEIAEKMIKYKLVR